jgi:hypothetical protein
MYQEGTVGLIIKWMPFGSGLPVKTNRYIYIINYKPNI